MRDDNQSFLYIKNLIDAKVLEPKKFTIVNFDSHHDAYVHWEENWFRSVDGRFHNYDNMIAPFIQDWVTEIFWVYPDYFTDDMLKSHFRNMNVTYTMQSSVIVNISPTFKITIKPIKWSNYNPDFFNWKYFNLIINPEMSKATSKMIEDIAKYVSVF